MEPLGLTAATLGKALSGTKRGIKATLLDQAIVAGLGNIYVDEALFAAGLHPMRAAGGLTTLEVGVLLKNVKRILRGAIREGGSTLRDYVDAGGKKGSYQQRHQVYGRGGEGCRKCEGLLTRTVINQRTTVYCARCQPM